METSWKRFGALSRLRSEIEPVLRKQVLSLEHYWHADKLGFAHLKDQPNQSKASTATCIASLTATDAWAKDWGRSDAPPNPWATKGTEIATSLISGPWESAGLPKNNAFTTSFVLEAAAQLLKGQAVPERVADKIRQAQDLLLEGPPLPQDDQFKGLIHGPASVYRYRGSAYLTHLAWRALTASKDLPERPLNDLSDWLNETRRWAHQELAEQLALRQAGSKNADSFELVYAALLVMNLNHGHPKPADVVLARAAVQAFFADQLPDGSWPRSLPLFHYPDVGAAFAYDYETLAQLLESPGMREDLLRHLDNLTAAARRALSTCIRLDNDGMGWSSGHHRHIAEPESWSTASVYHFLQNLSLLLAEALRREAFANLEQPHPVKSRPTPEFASRMLDCPTGAGEGSLKADFEKNFAALIRSQLHHVRRNRAFPEDTPTSALLFGPPGTSKTELAKEVAAYLGWPLLKVDPSHLVKSGMDLMQAEADHLFHVLLNLDEVVILLDEIDELVRDRGNNKEMQSRFLTTFMLPKLAALQKRRRLVWLAATNHLEQFDVAIRRPGRFDVVVQVLPPSAKAKLDHWPILNEVIEGYEPGLAQLADLTYLETKALVKTLESAPTLQGKIAALQKQYDGCTMKTPNGKDTWGRSSAGQASKCRWM